jgi:hypothetical protein
MAKKNFKLKISLNQNMQRIAQLLKKPRTVAGNQRKDGILRVVWGVVLVIRNTFAR